MKFVDTHAHVNFPAYKEDSEEVISRTLASGVRMICPGAQFSTSKRALSLAEGREGMWAAVGLHPFHLEENPETRKEEFERARYEELASHEKAVAIGEVGLDFWNLPEERKEEVKERQISTLKAQCDLASDLNLPLIFHCRGAHRELIELLRERSVRGVVHCFTGTKEEARAYLDMGLFLGFNGIIFKLPSLNKIIREVPRSRILLETDAPYLTPPPREPGSRNEPVHVKYIAEQIAKIRGESVEEVASYTSENAELVFRLS